MVINLDICCTIVPPIGIMLDNFFITSIDGHQTIATVRFLSRSWLFMIQKIVEKYLKFLKTGGNAGDDYCGVEKGRNDDFPTPLTSFTAFEEDLKRNVSK